ALAACWFEQLRRQPAAFRGVTDYLGAFMTDTVLAVRADSRYFYFRMALAFMAVAFIGFAPTYWAPMVKGTFQAAPVYHLHGLIFFSWTLYFVFQTWLAASGQIVRHRSVGLIGISLATAMT